MANLWSGRFSRGMDLLVQEYNASIPFDHVLYQYDIEGSIAHVTMLADQGIVSQDESQAIIAGLKAIRQDMDQGNFQFNIEDEDIHMAVEKELIRKIGDVGRKLHTARSRNDQVILDTRMYLRNEIKQIYDLLRELCMAVVGIAKENLDYIMPGFTHLQHAQPVSIGFHFVAYFQQIKRDMERLVDCYERVDYCPLGACALAGTTLPIDRHKTAKLLGFKNICDNAMDAVSDRDFIVEFISFSALCMTHLSRFAEEFILWNSQEFGFIDIDDSFCTGSSIMPQKKNPDIPELVRGKTGRVFGHLMSILTVLKGLPMAFNKDLQEDKEALFDTVKTVKDSIQIFAELIKKTRFDYGKISEQMEKGFLNATDLAEYLVSTGISFRTAHELVGKMVKYCEEENMKLEDLEENQLTNIDQRLAGITLPPLDHLSCVKRRTSFGGTAPVEVQRQIQVALKFLESDPFK